MTVKVDIKALLESGAHFGHKTSRWHPKMAPYIYGKRNNAHIINLEKTVETLNATLPLVTNIAKSGRKILFVGTKKQLKDITKDAAVAANMPYVTIRWVGGTLTNVTTINRQIKKLQDLERRMESGELESRYSKLEVQRYQEEIDTLNERYGGIKDMTEQPAALIVASAKTDAGAVKEARSLGIPVFAIADTNVDPSVITYPIPANDDAIKSVALILDYFVQAINAGKGTPSNAKNTASNADKIIPLDANKDSKSPINNEGKK